MCLHIVAEIPVYNNGAAFLLLICKTNKRERKGEREKLRKESRNEKTNSKKKRKKEREMKAKWIKERTTGRRNMWEK
jgi:hypothetical protein